MAMGGGTFVVVGTTIVAVLAVGAAIGADAVAGTPEAAPAATIAMSDDFCTLMGELNTYYAARSVESGLLAGTIDLSAGDDPAVLDAIHQQADPLLEITAAMAAYLGHGSEVVADARIGEALLTMSAYTKAQGETMAELSRDAPSVEVFIAAIMADPDPATEQDWSDAMLASIAITDYVATECAIDISTVLGTEPSGDPADGSTSSATGAKSDASTLGMEIATVFVDWVEGDPPPTVALSDDMYVVTATKESDGGMSFTSSTFSAASSDPAIVDQAINSPTDWCVSVTDNAAASPTTHRYSATGGLEEGTCAALVDAA